MSRDLDQDWLSRAIVLWELGRLEEADEALREALREEPNDPLDARYPRARPLDLDRADGSFESASTAIALAPEHQLGHTARARALLSLERFDEAEASANEAIRLDPEDAEMHGPAGFRSVGQRAMGRGARGCWTRR